MYSEDVLAVNDVLAQCGRQCWGSKGMHWQGRGPALPGLKDIGIRDGTFTFLLGVVIVGVCYALCRVQSIDLFFVQQRRSVSKSSCRSATNEFDLS